MNYFQKIENKDEWQNLLSKALFKTFFHTLAWENFLESQFNWLKFERYVWQDKVLLSLARCKVRGREKLISHPFCEYGGPLPLKEKIDLEQFKKALFARFQTDFSINFHPKVLNYFSNIVLPAPARRRTYFIEDLGHKTKEELWSSLRKTLRQAIEKSQMAGLEITEVRNEQELKKFYALYLKTCKRNKILAYPYSFFSYFLNNVHSEIILARHKNKLIAGSVFLLHKGFIHYFFNASDKKYKVLYANHLILWLEVAKYAAREKEFFDLGGTRAGSSLEIFKSGWGAKQEPIFELTNQFRGLNSAEGNLTSLTQEKLRRSPLRKIWGVLPTFAIRALSPWLLRYKI